MSPLHMWWRHRRHAKRCPRHGGWRYTTHELPGRGHREAVGVVHDEGWRWGDVVGVVVVGRHLMVFPCCGLMGRRKRKGYLRQCESKIKFYGMNLIW